MNHEAAVSNAKEIADRVLAPGQPAGKAQSARTDNASAAMTVSGQCRLRVKQRSGGHFTRSPLLSQQRRE